MTARGDFLDALRSTASSRESITCYADGIVLHQRASSTGGVAARIGTEIWGTWAILASFRKWLGVGGECRFAIEWRW
jgi:hypothetical protein